MDKQQIVSFAVNNDKLELLQARMNRFNPLKILKVQDHEIRHSNILAWMFDPNENHNFDDRILKRFILKALLKPQNDEILENMNMIYELQQMSLIDVEVFRELDNIDLVLVSERQMMVIFIENKIYSSEHSNQLERYYELIKLKYLNYKLIPIFLTLEGIDATHKKYFSAGYQDILETIEFVIDNYRDRTTDEVVEFIEYYLRTLKEKYVMDDELKQLCRDIYKNNKDVIDMIHSVGNEIDMEGAIDIFNEKYENLISISIKPRQFWFAIKEFEKARGVGDIDITWGGFPIIFWFSEYSGKLKFTLEVGPFEDAYKRISFLEALGNTGIKINEKSKQPGKKYTRIYTDTCPIKDWTDPEELGDKMEYLYNKNKVDLITRKVIEAIDSIEWNELRG